MKRTLFAAIAVFALVRLVRADELEDSYAKLKATVEKKDARSEERRVGKECSS